MTSSYTTSNLVLCDRWGVQEIGTNQKFTIRNKVVNKFGHTHKYDWLKTEKANMKMYMVG